jgi:hypothetical protein
MSCPPLPPHNPRFGMSNGFAFWRDPVIQSNVWLDGNISTRSALRAAHPVIVADAIESWHQEAARLLTESRSLEEALITGKTACGRSGQDTRSMYYALECAQEWRAWPLPAKESEARK